MNIHRVRPNKEKDRPKLDRIKNHNIQTDGYNMLEIVIAVGLILILSAGGILIFSGITADAKLAKVTSAAKNIYIAAKTNQLDNDPETNPTDTADRYNDSNESITIKIRETGPPPADLETAPDFEPESDDDFCIIAIWDEKPTIKGYAGVCSITDNGGAIIPPVGGGGDYVWDLASTMTTTWNTSLGANCEVITLPVGGVKPGTTVDWGDGNGAIAFTATSPNYGNSGAKTITISGEFDAWGELYWPDSNCLTQVTQWGDTGTIDLTGAFSTANNLTLVKAIPETTQNLYGAFLANTGDPDISGIRTPNATNMIGIFAAATNFNQPLSNFDTSNVTDMSWAFQYTDKFDQPLNFNTSNVLNMKGMFNGATKFNKPVNFETSNVTDMSFMFDNALNFDQPIDFKSHKVTDMTQMFNEAKSFNKSVKLDTTSVTNMRSMLQDAVLFDQPLNFKTSNVTNMMQMFSGATDFDQDISKWNVSSLIKASSMFSKATNFNQDLSSWDLSRIAPNERADFDYNTPNWVLPKPKFN